MAMSLEDLLAEEGFKRRKDKMKGRASFASERGSGPRYMEQERRASGPLLAVRRTERTRSDVPRTDSNAEFSTSGSFSVRKPRDNLIRKGKMGSEPDKAIVVNDGRRSHGDLLDAKRFSIASSSEITEVIQSDEVVEEGMERLHKDMHSNKVHGRVKHEGNHSAPLDDIVMENQKDRNNSFKHTYPHAEGRSNKVVESGSKFDESRSMRQNKIDEAQAAPALDEAAVKAIISIISGHAKRFLEDEDFRTSLRHNTFASLNLIGADESLSTESKVVGNLEEAIETIERSAEEESANLKVLKRASLQLSVITGLNSSDLKDGFTYGVPNLRFSACAHLYLSVIYVLQKKDKVAAKHLLQVFCDSPFQARTMLLPDLWGHLFLPHLLHLKVWYEKETHTVVDSPSFMNLKLLDKAYNESLDSGTCRFAMYYKDWIINGEKEPSVPVVGIPSFSVHSMLRGGLLGHTSSPASHVSPQPMVSKELYDEVFKHADKPGVESDFDEEEKFDRSSNGPAPQDRQLILCTHDSIVQADKGVDPVRESPPENERVIMQIKEPELSIQELQENYESCIGKHVRCSIPKDFVCPLTGLLFRNPVTLETGETFEQEVIADWFSTQGCFMCPVTRKTLQYQAVPPTNFILKRIIDKWKTDYIEHILALLSQVTSGDGGGVEVNDTNMIISILGKLLPVFSEEQRTVHARRVLSLGGLRLLLTRFQSSSAEEKTFISELLCCCVEADANCRNRIARDINQSNLLEMLHSEQLVSRKNAVLLLAELVCFNRRTRAKRFLERLGDEELRNAIGHLNMYLQACPLEETPLVAVLILHIDLLSGRCASNTYRQNAVDALTTALVSSLTDNEKVQNKCCRALLILGGFFSSSGKLMTEDWILKLAGFPNGPDLDDADDCTTVTTFLKAFASEYEEEEAARERWLTSLSASLLGDGKKSFLDAISKCLRLGKPDLVRVCLTTVAWLSFSLASLHDTRHQLYAFSALISPLRQYLEHGVLVEQRALAALSLLNFSTIPECRILLIKIGDEIGPSLDELAEVTWTAMELNTIISGQRR
ncbi:putative E3 ubiquitin-protein ligase LIN isoform X2 [Salvia hispanica]|uniref:putative E3 ubiquitin-protein ligase LIN isoform X2 n=1 Tax=Salvia hispanica TaxID=49212 RepID=UPI00200934D2|nr:putative E3 ubiquitin-protein ligase LIN isoform X2 [Salvia hispanica]